MGLRSTLALRQWAMAIGDVVLVEILQDPIDIVDILLPRRSLSSGSSSFRCFEKRSFLSGLRFGKLLDRTLKAFLVSKGPADILLGVFGPSLRSARRQRCFEEEMTTASHPARHGLEPWLSLRRRVLKCSTDGRFERLVNAALDRLDILINA